MKRFHHESKKSSLDMINSGLNTVEQISELEDTSEELTQIQHREKNEKYENKFEREGRLKGSNTHVTRITEG